ncbi:MAG: molybdopterin-dependent oxidoreductase, partial [Raoultibacter sp.]
MKPSNTTLSRRGFLKIGATSAVLASAGTLQLNSWQTKEAYATANMIERHPSLCNGCSNKCGLWANTRGGRIWTVEGQEEHPYSKGTICARGHGFAQLTYGDQRLTQPLKRTESGDYEPISWDTAFSEIGERLKGILGKYGPDAFAFIQDPRPSGAYYASRFTTALGSPNIYTHGAACNLSKESGHLHTLGGSFSADVANTKMLMFIGRSYADGIRPSAVNGLVNLSKSRKAKIVMVDPRYNSSAKFADQWLPIIPGTDLAFILALCNVLITEDLYHHDFVATYVQGFDEFKAEVATYTPAWAEKICDIKADTITTLAREMAAAAPAAVVEPSWRAAFGCAHKNSFETARAVAACNALLGNYGQKGGALLTSSPKAGALDGAKFPAVPKPKSKKVGAADYPLAVPGMGTNLAVLKAALEGNMHAVFFYNSNAAKGYSQPKAWSEGLSKVDLVVAIDIQMSETAMQADYVLPECSYLERFELPDFLGGKTHSVALRSQAVEKIHPETKPFDEIIVGLAKACGIEQYFPFTVEELAEAQLATVGVSLSDLKEQGLIKLPDPGFQYGVVPKFKTPSGKIELNSDAVAAAGLNGVISYIERKAKPAQ